MRRTGAFTFYGDPAVVNLWRSFRQCGIFCIQFFIFLNTLVGVSSVDNQSPIIYLPIFSELPSWEPANVPISTKSSVSGEDFL